jgi:hypothetical protein
MRAFFQDEPTMLHEKKEVPAIQTLSTQSGPPIAEQLFADRTLAV